MKFDLLRCRSSLYRIKIQDVHTFRRDSQRRRAVSEWGAERRSVGVVKEGERWEDAGRMREGEVIGCENTPEGKKLKGEGDAQQVGLTAALIGSQMKAV